MQDKEFDFKKTLFLPDTSFPMRASLPTREPGWLEHWNRLKIYYKLRIISKNYCIKYIKIAIYERCT